MDTKVLIMGVTRLIFGAMSLSGALLMLYHKDLQQAVKINAFLGSIGPFIFAGLSLLGIAGLATQIEPKKIVMLIIGVTLIVLGTR